MGFYENWVLPRLLDFPMRNQVLDSYRRNAITPARGLALEIGVGSGLNLSLYGPAVRRVDGLDPSTELLLLASKQGGVSGCSGLARQSFGGAHSVRRCGFDVIVMTWTLCSIPSPIAALTEMRRVLKPGGRLVFVEHGLSPETRIARWQHRLTPYWKLIGGGCHLDRKMDELIRSAGFEIDAIETGYMRGPKPWTFIYQGAATI